jgi:predicted alpha-1,2-mannosidase
MNYYVADAVIARAAKLLGRDDDNRVLEARSKRYGVLFNKETGFFQPKDASGNFHSHFDPLAWKEGFTESGAWQYRFYVPHDVDGLKDLHGGGLCDRIGAMMTQTTGPAFHVGGYGLIHEMSELGAIQADFGLYAHNNQPVHHVLWVARKAGCNELAEKYLRKVMHKLYTLDGWPGDEDNGEMGAWYVLSALGLYSLEGAKDELVIGSPAVVGAKLRLPKGQVLQVAVENQGEDNVYVRSLTWTPTGGLPRDVTSNTLRYTELMGGGILAFTMASEFVPRASFPSAGHSA